MSVRQSVLDILGWHLLDSSVLELREQNHQASQWALNPQPRPMEEKDGKQIYKRDGVAKVGEIHEKWPSVQS